MQQNKRKLVKATQTGTITIKISTTSFWRYSNKMDGELPTYGVQLKKSNRNFTTDTVHFATSLDRKQNFQ